jgi:predicted nucleotidyltransferase
VDLLVDIEPSSRRFSLIDLSTPRLALEDLLGRETQVTVRADLRPAFLARIGDDPESVLEEVDLMTRPTRTSAPPPRASRER